MLDTGSGPNIIKENLIPEEININYTNILKLNGINNYPVYTLGEITLTLFEIPVIFHIVSNDFPISQSGILGNDFFKQTSSKIDYAQGHLDVSGINIPFLSPEAIIVAPRSESLFYVRIENPEQKVGYIPRLKVAHGIYLGDTIVENVAGKAYLNIISTLDEEAEVHVPTLRLKSLSELLDDHDSKIEALNSPEEPRNKEEETTYKFDDYENNMNIENKGENVDEENIIIEEINYEDEEQTLNKEGNKNKNKIKNKEMIKNKNERKNKELNDSKIFGEGNYQTSPENLINPTIPGGGNYQTSPKNLINLKTLEERNYQSSQEGNNSRISEGNFQTLSENPSSVDCEEENYQTSLRISAKSHSKKGRSPLSSLDIKFPKVGLFKEENDNELKTSHVTIKDLLEEAQKYNLKIKNSNLRNMKNKNKPSSKILISLLNKSQEILEKFMRNHKTRYKRKQEVENYNLRNCLTISEEKRKNRPAEIIESLRLEHLNETERKSIIKLITDSQDRFHIPGEKLTATHVLQHRIPTTDDQPINTRQYRFPQIHKEEINKQVEELLEGGIVKHSQSPYNTPIWIVPKKEDSQGNKRWRMVLDFRALNDKTIGDAYPLPNIVDILDQLGGARYFSVCDLASGFHQIKMNREDGHKTAFTTPFGHYEFDRMPFGLKNAPATFQRLMDLVLTGLQGKELFVYMDDIVIYATSLEEHERKYNALIERLREANLKLQPDKCEFLKTEVTYLGHVISKDGVKPDPKKLEAVQRFPRPKTPKNIKQFLGLAGYYRRFIPNFSKFAKPLTNLLKNDTRFEWTSVQEESFEILKQKLCEEPVLQYPDFSKSFILTTDASGIAVGGILSQGEINKDLPIAYASRTLTDNELKYDTYEKEALAIVYCVKHFRPYLYGRKFTLVTDHKPLMWFKNAQDANMRILRWRLKLAEYDYEVVYKAGKTNVNADALSRNPVNIEEIDCKIIKNKKLLNPDNPKDARLIAELLEKSDSEEEEEEDDDFHLYLSDMEENEEIIPESDLLNNNNDTLPFTQTELNEPDYLSITEKALIHDPPKQNKIQTRSRTARQSIEQNKITNELHRDEGEIEEIEERNDPPDKISDSEKEDEEENEQDIINKNLKSRKTKPAFIENGITHGNVIDSRELLFLRKDNIVYFVDTQGKPLDSGSQKLFERKELPNLGSLVLGKVKAIKYKNHYHVALPVSEEQREGPTATLKQIVKILTDLRKITEDLKLETFSIAKTELINNVPWNDVKLHIQSIFTDAPTKVIICHGLIKYPPKDLRSVIISEMHCLPTGGHRGVTKTYNRIKHNYYWENLKADVQRYIQQCLQCQLKKLVRVKTKQPMIITDTPGSSFDKVAMDIVGPLPKTERGNEYILTLQDQLTKFCMGIPLPNQTSETIAEAFVDRFICVLGAPKAILTDQGRNFLSDLIKKIAKLFKIRKFRTTAFHPQSNGSLERSHHALGEYLKQYANEQKQWDRWISLAMFNYNTSVHEATKHTPYELVFGKIARVPSNELLPPGDKLANYDEYLINLVTQLHAIQGNARDNVIQAKIKSKNYYDRKINPQTFKPGDQVFLLKGPKPGKFGDQYTGPHEVLEIFNKNNVKIRIKKNTRIVHPNRLRISYIKPTDKE
ncbi:Retrovirus-related Pol polyprotein from transposon 17.6 [Formica fusca]